MAGRKSEKIGGSTEALNSFQITAATAGMDKASKAVLHNIEVIATILKKCSAGIQGLFEKGNHGVHRPGFLP